jgi:hypothetical protein
MFLRANKRFKDGKEHRYWSVVENRRVAGGRSVQKTLLDLGEINDSDRAAWTGAIEAVDEREQTRQIHLFPEDRTPDPRLEHPTLQLRLAHIELARPRQWGGCWLALELWHRLDLDAFWQPLLPDSQKGTPWLKVLKTLVVYRLLAPGSEWNLHRSWFDNGPVTEASKLKAFGYSRDKRPDCVQIVIALIITPDVFISFLAYCLHVTLEKYNKKAATGLSSRSVLERLSEIQMLDVTIPATDGREVRMRRYTKPEKVHHLLLDQLGFTLPAQPPPEIRNPGPVVETF